MSTAVPILYEFPHSHFCEIARWGLDHKGIRYQSRPLLPGYHIKKIKKIAAQSSVPVLCDGGRVVQGSQTILDYLDATYPDNPLSSTQDKARCSRLEQRITKSIGVPLRRLCYAYLLDRPDLVRYFFMHRSSAFENFVFALAFPMLSKRLRRTYDCTESGAESAKHELRDAFDYFDELLADRRYFFGDSLSRADITFASLSVFLVMPPEYPVDWPEDLAAHALTQWFGEFADRPSYHHVQRMYAMHRHGSSDARADND